jgi:AmmeMemoRadiSam system protein B
MVLETPLGNLAVDRLLAEQLLRLPQVTRNRRAHAREHALEVQFPFLKHVLEPQVTVIPLVVGDATAEEVAEVMQLACAEASTVALVSSDLSHYLSYEQARTQDTETAEQILHLNPVKSESACGAFAINGLLHWARMERFRVKLLSLRSSGDTAGGRDRVVGYGAFAVGSTL